MEFQIDQYGTLLKYQGKASVREVRIPANVKRIGSRAFQNCTQLKAVYVPDAVEAIESLAFAGCTSLVQVRLPLKITEIGIRAFDDTPWMQTLWKGDYAFIRKGLMYAYRGTAKELIIPGEIWGVTGNAFARCRSLERVVIPEHFHFLRSAMFAGCTNLREAVLPDTLDCIEAGAFQDCSSLHTMRIPKAMLRITQGAFSGCTGLRDLPIPDTVISIDRAAFWNCIHLRRVVIPESVTQIGADAFGKCYALYRLEIPASVQKIGENAFRECSSLHELILPDNGMEIAPNAFPLTAGVHIRTGDTCVQVYHGNITQDAYLMRWLVRFLCEADGYERENMFRQLYKETENDLKKAAANPNRKNCLKREETRSSMNALYPIAVYMVLAYGGTYYCDFLRSYLEDAGKAFAEWNDAALMANFLKTGLVNRELLERLISYAVEQEATICCSELLRYKNEVIGFEKPEDMFAL